MKKKILIVSDSLNMGGLEKCLINVCGMYSGLKSYHFLALCPRDKCYYFCVIEGKSEAQRGQKTGAISHSIPGRQYQT